MASRFWTTEPDGYVEPRVGSKGIAAVKPETVLQVFQRTAEKFGDKGAMYLKRPVDGVIPDHWQVWTWNDYFRDCRSFAKSLIHLDVKAFRIVNILGFNSVR